MRDESNVNDVWRLELEPEPVAASVVALLALAAADPCEAELAAALLLADAPVAPLPVAAPFPEALFPNPPAAAPLPPVETRAAVEVAARAVTVRVQSEEAAGAALAESARERKATTIALVNISARSYAEKGLDELRNEWDALWA